MPQSIFIPPSFIHGIYPVYVANEQELRDFLDACSQSGLIVHRQRTVSWCRRYFETNAKIYLRCDFCTVQASARLSHPDF